MIDVDLKVECDNCHKTCSEFSDVYCDDCEEKKEEEMGRRILTGIYKGGDFVLDGEFVCGFKSAEEKEIFMRGARYGYNHAAFELCNMFGDNLNREYEELSEIFNKKPIEVKYNPDDEID